MSGPLAYEQIPALVELGKQWVASVAGITAVVIVDFATMALSLPIPEPNVASKCWYDAVASRPSFKA